MNMSDFYEFSDDNLNTTFQASGVGLKKTLLSDWPVHDAERLPWGDDEGIAFPVVFEHSNGRIFRDMLSTGWPSFYLISDKMKEVLMNAKLTGWKTFPIRLFDKTGKEKIGYHGFSVTGKGGPIDYTKGAPFEKNVVLGPKKFYKGLYVDLNKWDGNDFFRPEIKNFIIITEKAAKVIKESHLTNIHLTKLTDFEIPEWIFQEHSNKII